MSRIKDNYDMVFEKDKMCPVCGEKLKHYDRVKRVKRTKNRITVYIIIDRVHCLRCGKIHRVIPNDLLPFKQYEAEVIFGVREGFITPDTLGFEDYPCEKTIKRWLLR